jgi:hypothetical protein
MENYEDNVTSIDAALTNHHTIFPIIDRFEPVGWVLAEDMI